MHFELPINSRDSHISACEFCTELSGRGGRFSQLYGSNLSRVTHQNDYFVCMPTIGQLFEGSMLIVPRIHVDRASLLHLDSRNSLAEIIDTTTNKVASFGTPIVFEHGACEHTGGGCGIYHAHIHIVPVPHALPVLLADLMPTNHYPHAASIDIALSSLEGAMEYLWLRDSIGDVGYIAIDAHLRSETPSQYFRRRIVEHCGLNIPWDWRCYGKESRLISTINTLGEHAA